MHEVLVNRLGGLSLSRKNVVRLTDGPDMTLDVYCGHKTTTQQQQWVLTLEGKNLRLLGADSLLRANPFSEDFFIQGSKSGIFKVVIHSKSD